MAGSGTVLADDPMLNCRIPGGRDPIRVICDSRLRTPLTSHIVQTARDISTIIATWSFLEAGLVQHIQAYIAPKIIGGAGAKSPVGGQGFPTMPEAIRLRDVTITRLGEDILIESEVEGPCSQGS